MPFDMIFLFVWFFFGLTLLSVVLIFMCGNFEETDICPQCFGRCGVNVAAGMFEEQADGTFIECEDWHDCDMCESTGKVKRKAK